jgi:3-hydroxyisobutyrate dehydrogenase-like beta-hydroxyacid dehydrogenase
VVVYDLNHTNAQNLVSERVKATVRRADLFSSLLIFHKDRIEDLASQCSVILSMLPNDAAVNQVSDLILKNSGANTVHISCSTVSPTTSRKLSEIYRSQGKEFIAAPVFARPDGLARRQAVWMIAGAERGRKLAAQLLESSGKVDTQILSFLTNSRSWIMARILALPMSSNYVATF